MSARTLSFAPPPSLSSAEQAQPSYSLLTLTPALLALLEKAIPGEAPFEIRGHASDGAVLVTPTETFSLRGVQNSNSLCLSQTTVEGKADWYRQGQSGEGPRSGVRDGGMVIESVLHETLEVLPAAAKTERLEGLLRGADYTGETNEINPPKDKLIAPRHTLSTLRSLIPASDAAITQALRTNRVVSIQPSSSTSGAHLRPLPPSYLLELLPPLLASIAPADEGDEDQPRTPTKANPAKKSKGKEKAKEAGVEAVTVVVTEQELLDTLDAHDCGEEVGRQVLGWFGREDGEVAGRWRVEVDQVVKEVGTCLLAKGGNAPQPREKFLLEWRRLCGGFRKLVRLELLAGTFILPASHPPTITFLPSARLSSDPGTRFDELFSLLPRWRDTEMVLFLDDLVGGDKKKRDAMVLKFVRKVKEPDGATVWTSRFNKA